MGEEVADEGGGGGDDGLVGECDFDWSEEDVGFEALDVAEVFEDLGGSLSAVSEVEVVAFDDDVGVVFFDDLIEEGFWVHREEFWSWGQFDDLIGSGGEEAGFAGGEGFDLGGGLGGKRGEDGDWVGVEGEDDDFAVVSCVLSCPFDEHLVALVDAVEVADGEGGLD